MLFDVSQYDNTRFALSQNFQETRAENDDDCALKCLQNEFCDHFVFIRSIEPYGTKPNGKTVNWLRITMKTFWDANMIPCVPHYRHVNSFFKRKINEFCFFFLFQFFLLRLFRQRAYHKQHSEHFDLAQCNLQIQTCTKRQIELDRRSRDTGNK